MTEELTALELKVLTLVAHENWPGFLVDDLRVLKREHTGAGSYVYLSDGRSQSVPDGTYTAQGRLIEMAGVRNGLGFAIDVTSSRVNHIEFFTFGNNSWDGVERGWKIA